MCDLVKERVEFGSKGSFSCKGKKIWMSRRVFDQMSGGFFRTLIKKLISELTWKPRDESFEAFDTPLAHMGYCSTYG